MIHGADEREECDSKHTAVPQAGHEEGKNRYPCRRR